MTRRQGSKKRRSKPTGGQAKMVNNLKELVSIQKTQIGTSMLQVPDVPRIIVKRDKVHTFVRTADFGNMISSSVAVSGYAIAPSLSNLPNYTEFANLYEQWRFVQIVVRYIPFAIAPASSITTSLYVWIDQDDATTPTGVTEGYQSQTLLIAPSNQPWERTFTPHAAIGAYGGSVFTNYASAPSKMWMDNASSAINYYGLKIAIPITGAGSVILGNVTYSVVLQCRRPF